MSSDIEVAEDELESGRDLTLVRIMKLHRPDEVIWKGISLRSIYGEDWDGTSANLKGMDLSGARFVDVEMQGSDLSGANLSGTEFLNCNLSDCDFRGALLDGANFGGATFDMSDLVDAIIDPPSDDDLDGVYLKFDDSEAVGNCESGSVAFARSVVPGGSDVLPQEPGVYLMSDSEVMDKLEATPAHVILERGNKLWFHSSYWRRFLLALWEAVYRTKEEKGERKRYASGQTQG